MVDCDLFHRRSCRIFCPQNCSIEQFNWLNKKCKIGLRDDINGSLDIRIDVEAKKLHSLVASSCMATNIYGRFADSQKFNRMIYSATKVHRWLNICIAFAYKMIYYLYLMWYKVAIIVEYLTYHSYHSYFSIPAKFFSIKDQIIDDASIEYMHLIILNQFCKIWITQ